MNNAMKQAQDAVEAAAQDDRLEAQARDRAQQVLRGAFKTIGWKLRLR
jgi:hypothetical protein